MEMWQLCGWRRWDMHQVTLAEYVAACNAIRDLRAG